MLIDHPFFRAVSAQTASFRAASRGAVVLPALRLGLFMVAAMVAAGCHGSGDFEPLGSQKIYVSDKFFDVAVLDEQNVFVVGYGGKILSSSNGGMSWDLVDSGTDSGLFSISFSDDKNGWIVGQEGMILRTVDGGNSWTRQTPEIFTTADCRDTEYRDSVYDDCRLEKDAAAEILRSLGSKNLDTIEVEEARLERECRQFASEECPQAYLFSVQALDADSAVAIGDRSVFMRTDDGGASWSVQTLTAENTDIDPNWAIVFEDPVLYDVEFVDDQNGFVVGEFGKIYHTADGGETWMERQKSLMDETIFDIMDLPTLFDVEIAADGKSGVVVGLDGRVGRSSDGGKTWGFEPHGVKEYVDPFYSGTVLGDGTVWAVGSSGQVVKTGDDGRLSRGSFGTAINSWVRRIRFIDNENGWVVGGFGLIMNTTDGGKTWYRRMG